MTRSLPPGAVRMDAATLPTYRGAFAPGVEPLGIARPRSIDDITRLVAWARRHKLPIASFASAAAAAGRRRRARVHVPALCLDLSAMRRIIAIDRRDRVAVIEAGVTFEQLDAELAPYGLRAFKPLRPRATKSVLASYLDREPILQSREHWDVLDPIGAGEIVFGTGERYRTGSASGPATPEAMWNAGVRFLTAVGPGATDFMRVVQGARGELGIVPWAAVLCEPLPLSSVQVFVPADTPAPLCALSAELHRRRLGAASFMVDRAHLASLLAEDGDAARALAAHLPAWALYVELTAHAELPSEQIAYEREDLAEVASSFGLTVHDALADRPATLIGAAQSALSPACYKDAARGDHDSVFFLSTLDKVPALAGIAARLARAHGLPDALGIYVQPRLHGRNCHVEFVLSFDPLDPDEAAQVTRLAKSLAEESAASGGFFSRPHDAWRDIARAQNPTILPALRQARALFDPDGILGPPQQLDAS